MTDISKEHFREKSLKLIDKYKEEFGVNISTKLTIKANSSDICKTHADVHGIEITGIIMINAVLMNVSDEDLEKAIRYAVYMMAVDYEEKCSNLAGFSAKIVSFPDSEVKSSAPLDTPEEAKFTLNVSHQEYLKIVDGINEVIKHINEGRK